MIDDFKRSTSKGFLAPNARFVTYRTILFLFFTVAAVILWSRQEMGQGVVAAVFAFLIPVNVLAAARFGKATIRNTFRYLLRRQPVDSRAARGDFD